MALTDEAKKNIRLGHLSAFMLSFEKTSYTVAEIVSKKIPQQLAFVESKDYENINEDFGTYVKECFVQGISTWKEVGVQINSDLKYIFDMTVKIRDDLDNG